MNTSPPLVIYGAGGLGGEILACAIRAGRPVKGFIDDGLPAGSEQKGLPVLGGFEWLKQNEVEVLMAFGDPMLKQKIFEKLDPFKNVIHSVPLMDPKAVILDPSRVEIGAGSMLTAGTVLTTGIKIGKGVLINLNCTIGHDSIIGDYTSVMPSCNIAGNVRIGVGVFIGSGANILGGITIGDGAMIGAGSVVNHDVAPGKKVIGMPAREISRV